MTKDDHISKKDQKIMRINEIQAEIDSLDSSISEENRKIISLQDELARLLN